MDNYENNGYGYNPNQNNGYAQNQGYNQNQGYAQNQGYVQNNDVNLNKGYQNTQQSMGYTNNMPRTGWSWGAFMFSICWGIGNYCWQPFLLLIPIFNIFWWFVCGAKGHTWAMQSGKFRTVEEFNAVQDSWDRAGKIFFIIYLVIFVLSFICSIIMGASLVALLGSLGDSYY